MVQLEPEDVVKVRLVGVEPKTEPGDPRQGWYCLEAGPGCTVAAVLARFGLGADGLSVLRNGFHAGAEDPVADHDELHVFLKSLGG